MEKGEFISKKEIIRENSKSPSPPKKDI